MSLVLDVLTMTCSIAYSKRVMVIEIRNTGLNPDFFMLCDF